MQDQSITESKHFSTGDFARYRLALWGSMTPWRPQLKNVLEKCGMDTTTIFDPTPAEGQVWDESMQAKEEAAKPAIRHFIHLIGGSHDDPSSLALESSVEASRLAMCHKPGDGIFVLDAARLKPHHVSVLRLLRSDLQGMGFEVVDTLPEVLPWVLKTLVPGAVLYPQHKKNLVSELNVDHSDASSKSFGSIKEVDSRTYHAWRDIIDRQVSSYGETGRTFSSGMQMRINIPTRPKFNLKRLVAIMLRRDVSITRSAPKQSIIDQLNVYFEGILVVKVDSIRPSMRDYLIRSELHTDIVVVAL